MLTREDILAYAIKYHGNWSLIANAIKQQEIVYPVTISTPYVTILDALYPKQLRSLRFPPWILFFQGNYELLNQPMISIVGSRNWSEYGRSSTQEVVANLNHNYVIVSGLAKGIDAFAHRYAMIQGMHTIGIIGNGLDIVYPKENQQLYQRMAKSELIISEYPPHTPPKKEHFPWRNRLIACLGKALIVTQATLRSGTMLTVNEALNLSKEIYCIPYSYIDKDGQGCNFLISQGANIITDVKMLREL